MMVEHGGMGGAVPFSATLIRSWAALMDIRPTPLEVSALVRMSHAWLHPPDPTEDEDEDDG